MNKILRMVLRRLGLVAIPARSWKDFERRFAEGEAERRQLALKVEAARGALAGSEFPVPGGDVAAGVRALRAGWAEHAAALVAQLSSAHAGAADLGAQAAALAQRLSSAEAAGVGDKLQACVRERDLLSLSIGRSGARVKALIRRRDRLTAERDVARHELAAGDASGRIRDLEAESRRLGRRVADLERYLAETRGEGARAYL